MGFAELIVILLVAGSFAALFIGLTAIVLVFWRVAAGRLASRSGWAALGARYATQGPAPGSSIWLGVVRLGTVPYKNIMRGAGTPAGLRLDLLAPFARGIRSVLVPWHEVRAQPITVHETRVELGAVATLTLATRVWQRIAQPTA